MPSNPSSNLAARLFGRRCAAYGVQRRLIWGGRRWQRRHCGEPFVADLVVRRFLRAPWLPLDGRQLRCRCRGDDEEDVLDAAEVWLITVSGVPEAITLSEKIRLVLA